MEENVRVTNQNGQEFIMRERKLAILIGIGYVFVLLTLSVANGLVVLSGAKRVTLFATFIVIGALFGCFGFFKKESQEIRQIKNGKFFMDEDYFSLLKQKYDKVKYIYNFFYLLSLAGVLAIIGRSFYIVVVYKACPQNDITIFSYGSIAIFCFSYVSGVLGAYKHLLRTEKREEA